MNRPSFRQRGSVGRWLLALLAVVVLLFLAGTWYVRENPLAVYERSTRRALARAGLELRTLDAEVGRIAYWEGGYEVTRSRVAPGLVSPSSVWAWKGQEEDRRPDRPPVPECVAGHPR